MIKQDIYLPKYDWYFRVYYAVDDIYVAEILGELEAIGCSSKELANIEQTIADSKFNFGVTYSNIRSNTSIIIIGITSTPEEFQNTFDHEKAHLSKHIAEVYDIDPYSEEYAYLRGEIGMKMFKVAKRFLCEHCRKELDIES